MYAKIYASMFKGSMYGNPDGIITFMLMLVLADREGIVDMTPEAISAQTSVPVETIRRGLEYLAKPDPRSRTKNEEGRRIMLLDDGRDWGWFIVNFAHYRDLRDEDGRREYFRNYKRAQRARERAQNEPPRNPVIDKIGKSLKVTHSESESESESYSEEDKIKSAKSPRAPRSAPAKRLPDVWELTSERREVAIAERLIDPVRVHATFVDYWHAASGAKARKHDWDATWRNWCRRTSELQKSTGVTFREKPKITWRPPAGDGPNVRK